MVDWEKRQRTTRDRFRRKYRVAIQKISVSVTDEQADKIVECVTQIFTEEHRAVLEDIREKAKEFGR